MRMFNYIVLCLIIAIAVAITVMYVPGVAETIETRLLAFLATNAS